MFNENESLTDISDLHEIEIETRPLNYSDYIWVNRLKGLLLYNEVSIINIMHSEHAMEIIITFRGHTVKFIYNILTLFF